MAQSAKKLNIFMKMDEIIPAIFMRPGGAEWPCIASGRVNDEGSKYSGAIRLNNISGARMTPHGRSEMAPCYGTLYIWFAGFYTADLKRYSRN